MCDRVRAPRPLGLSVPAATTAATATAATAAAAAAAAATAATATAAIATATTTTAGATVASTAPTCCTAMASLRVLAFDHEGRPVQFDTWFDVLQMYLLSDSKDSVSLFDLASGAAPAPPATADSATRSQWLTRDAAARLAIRNHLPLAECAHFGQHRIAQALYDTVVACYSSPATALLGRLLLPYQFPELSAFTTVEDLVSHLCTSDARYRATVPAEFLDRNQPPMFITLYFIVTRLPDSLCSVRDHFLSLDPTSLTVNLLEQHLLAAETSAVAGHFKFTPYKITDTPLQGRRDLITWREAMEPQLEVAGLKGFANGTVPIPLEDEVELRGEFCVVHMLTFMIISRCCSLVVQIALMSCRERLDAGHQAWRFILSTYKARNDLYIEQLEEQMTHLWMGEQESATDYYNRARIMAEMWMAGAEYSTASYITHVIICLLRNYNLMKRMMMVPSTHASLDEDSLTSYDIKDEALQEAE
ncbi:unnamed protein product [Closterium sp. NIES-53]